MKFKKNWIKMNDTKEEVEVTEETKEETKMSFFAKHKKGLIIGGLGALAAGVAGIFLASRKDDSDDYDEDYDCDVDDDSEADAESDEEA